MLLLKLRKLSLFKLQLNVRIGNIHYYCCKLSTLSSINAYLYC